MRLSDSQMLVTSVSGDRLSIRVRTTGPVETEYDDVITGLTMRDAEDLVASLLPQIELLRKSEGEKRRAKADELRKKIKEMERELQRVEKSEISAKVASRRYLCPECGLPEGQCDPEGVGHYRG